MKDSIEYGKQSPTSDFDRRPAVGDAGYKKGKKGRKAGKGFTQKKKVGMGDRGQRM